MEGYYKKALRITEELSALLKEKETEEERFTWHSAFYSQMNELCEWYFGENIDTISKLVSEKRKKEG